ncbi:MAG TPA: hypothetical protein VFX17_01265 [Patescibacteria group bacterium]|nr:hypothetical protein [Patescibacteria group bacterium]
MTIKKLAPIVVIVVIAIAIIGGLNINKKGQISTNHAQKQQQQDIYKAAEQAQLPQLQAKTNIILADAKASSDLKFVKDDTTSDGKSVKWYSYTDKYGRKVSYALGDDGIIWDSTASSLIQGNTIINSDANSGVPLGWKIYSNPAGYQVAYPPDWFISTVTQPKADDLSELVIQPYEPDYAESPYTFQIFVNLEPLEYFTNQLGDNKNNLKDIQLNGYEAKQLYLNGSPSDYYIERNGNTFVVSSNYIGGDNISKEDTDKVLSSFKFTQ